MYSAVEGYLFTLRDVSLSEVPSDWFNKELNDQ